MILSNMTKSNTNNKPVIIKTNWEQYLPREIYNILHPVIEYKHPLQILQEEKIKERENAELAKKLEIENNKREKKKEYKLLKNTPGTKEWCQIHFPNKLWPGHPLSEELSLVWGIVNVNNSLYIEGYVNNNKLKSVIPFKETIHNKSKGGGKVYNNGKVCCNYRKINKNIKLRPCTGLGVYLTTIRKWFINFLKSENTNVSNIKYFLPAAFINTSVDPTNKEEYKLYHVVPESDFPFCTTLNVLSNEMKYRRVEGELSNVCNLDDIFEDVGIDLDGINYEDEDEIYESDVNLDEITKKLLLIKSKNTLFKNKKELNKSNKNSMRYQKFTSSKTIIDEVNIIRNGDIIIDNLIISDEEIEENIEEIQEKLYNTEESSESEEEKIKYTKKEKREEIEITYVKPNTHKIKKSFKKFNKKDLNDPDESNKKGSRRVKNSCYNDDFDSL